MKNWTKIKNKKKLEIWRDNKTGLLWSPPINKNHTFDQAIAISQEEFVTNFGKYKNRIWAIPTRDEIAVAIANGLLDAIPGMKSFWSASVNSVYRQYAWFFLEFNGSVTVSVRAVGIGVRCVGRKDTK